MTGIYDTRRRFENPAAFDSSNQRTFRHKGYFEELTHTDGRRYELFEVVYVDPFNPHETLSERLVTYQARYLKRTLIAFSPSDQTLEAQPTALGVIYRQADTPVVFGWDWRDRPEKYDRKVGKGK